MDRPARSGPMLRHWYPLRTAGSIAPEEEAAVCGWRDAPRSRVRPPANASTAAGSSSERRVCTGQSLQHARAYNGGLQELRLDDPARRPRSYMDLIRDGQCVVFARDADSGRPCDGRGHPFADPDAVTCDVFDAGGRTRPPVLTVLHPSRVASLDSAPGAMRRRRVIAWALIVGGVPLIAYAYFFGHDVDMILPAFIGINMILAGGRLLWFNLGVRETERDRQERLDRLER